MADTPRRSLKDFDAYADRNGQDMGQDSPLDLGVPGRTQGDMAHDPMGQAEDARTASDHARRDATGLIDGSDATAAETPPENLRRISDPTPTPSPAAQEGITRATAALGQDEGETA